MNGCRRGTAGALVATSRAARVGLRVAPTPRRLDTPDDRTWSAPSDRRGAGDWPPVPWRGRDRVHRLGPEILQRTLAAARRFNPDASHAAAAWRRRRVRPHTSDALETSDEARARRRLRGSSSEQGLEGTVDVGRAARPPDPPWRPATPSGAWRGPSDEREPPATCVTTLPRMNQARAAGGPRGRARDGDRRGRGQAPAQGDPRAVREVRRRRRGARGRRLDRVLAR